MECMLLFTERKGAPKTGPAGFAAMKSFAAELAGEGKLRRGARLIADSAGARVRVRDGTALVSDGPFTESKEVVGGFWIVEVASRAEAIEIARRCPHARHGIVEVHLVQWRDAVADPGEGTPFLFAFRMEPGLTDPDGAKMREMVGHGESLKREGKFIETAPLAHDQPAARVEARGGTIVVTDGPFAESKEGVGGYSLVRAASGAEAIELATRYPHAKWGPVEVREIMYFDPT
jgi:hypothetical protein